MGKIDMGFIKLSYECSDLIEEIKGDISEFGEICAARSTFLTTKQQTR